MHVLKVPSIDISLICYDIFVFKMVLIHVAGCLHVIFVSALRCIRDVL